MDQSKYLPLYLKHRPQTLGDLVGQKSVVKTLTNAIENNRIAHAYLFTGPRGCGKTSSARILAKSINCENGPTVTPCLQCASCVSIKESSCPSVFEIDAASNNSVDDARMLIERAPLVAQGGRNKLYIVDECHMLTKEAFNALLKTIEEPPPNVIFILATTEEHKVPPTILSRCQRLMFRLANLDELAEHLTSVAAKENIEIQQDAIELITRKSGGGLRDALGLLDQASLLARPGEPVTQKDLLVLLGALDEDVLLTLSRGILERNGKDVLDGISGLVMQGREPALIAQELAKHFLNLAKASYVTAKEGNADEARRFVLGSKEYIEGLVEQSAQFERVELSQMVEQLDNLEQALKRSTQPSMTLEIALLSLCHRHDITSIRELEQKIAKLQEAMASGEMPRAASRPPGGPGASAAPPARPSYGGQPSPAAAPQSYSAAPRQEAVPRSEPAPRPEAPVSATPPAPPARVEPAASAAPAGGFALIQGDDDEDEEAAAPVVVSSVQTMDQAPAPAGGVMYDRSFEEEEEEGEGFASRPVAQAAASPAPVQRPAAQAPAPPQRQAAPPPPPEYVEGEGQGELSQSGLDEMWGELLEAIHKRSIPAFSLVSTHAFPIRFESKTLTIGVPKEFFQKSIENKTNKIMEAYRDVWNDEVRIIVKVIAEGAPPGGGAAHNAAPRGGDAPMQAAPPRNDVALRASQEPAAARLPQEPNNAYNRTPSNTATATRPEPSSGRSEQRDLDEEADRGRSQSAAPVVSQSKADTSAALDALGDGLDSGKIKEAYRIFEGPGSRLIS
ncbi:DNA polymerase III subunit gamma/tau [Candidatus Obscuribacterales bacterium]|nr:DNA polymerase III subunit gamma/tau [Candidatus Obscuribacterales bacterium]MBX3138158.1 DNA polymerase III subunit gamma/tau [Candidatus Obscuribacterales bacterium]MBX3150815.1 DNA polymerase III subunit gamma/tau [Candidatus Obscuribacterales bacterium]